MKYDTISIDKLKTTYHDTYAESQKVRVLSDKEILDRIDDKVIEAYIRGKKLNKINKNK